MQFYHYLDYLCGRGDDEDYTVLRTWYYIKENNIKNAGKLIFENTFDRFLNEIKKKIYLF